MCSGTVSCPITYSLCDFGQLLHLSGFRSFLPNRTYNSMYLLASLWHGSQISHSHVKCFQGCLAHGKCSVRAEMLFLISTEDVGICFQLGLTLVWSWVLQQHQGSARSRHPASWLRGSCTVMLGLHDTPVGGRRSSRQPGAEMGFGNRRSRRWPPLAKWYDCMHSVMCLCWDVYFYVSLSLLGIRESLQIHYLVKYCLENT